LDAEGVARGRAISEATSWYEVAGDLTAAVASLAPPVCVVGYCWGGTSPFTLLILWPKLTRMKRLQEGGLSPMNAPNPDVAIASAMKMTNRASLLEFREKMAVFDMPQVIQAIDQRLNELAALELHRAIGSPRTNLNVVQRVNEAVRVLEEVRAYNSGGRRHAASRTRQMIKARGEIDAVRRTVMNNHTSTGLEDLAAHGRLDCAFEQIILDFPEVFGPEVVAKAQANLDRRKTDS